MTVQTELSELVRNTSISIEDRDTTLSATYHPTAEHSELFVDITKDRNPIHQKHPEQGEAIAPGFMHTTTALMLIEKILREQGRTLRDFPYAQDTTHFNSAVVTGDRYQIRARVRNLLTYADEHAVLKAHAEILDRNGKCVYSLERTAHDAQEGRQRATPKGTLVHSSQFKLTKYGPLDFGRLIGSESPERTLCALAAASSVVFDAVEKGRVSIDPDTVAFYMEQRVASDISRTPDLAQGIHLELYTDKEQFGRRGGNDKTVEMQIAALDHHGGIMYVLTAPVSFQDERMRELILRRALRRKN